jgi:hypothetical protein
VIFLEENIMKKLIVSLLLILALSINASAVTTGAFTSPLTNATLSVDLNGGTITNQACPTEGWNGSYSSPAFGADPYGVTWSPWGGPTNTYGDGTSLPSGTGVTSISKTFGTTTLTISAPGVQSNYASAKFNSRDRANPTPNYTTDNDVFRDFMFIANGGINKQSCNHIKVTASGIAPGTVCQMALYSYDSSSSSLFMNWTATAPDSVGFILPSGSFGAPAGQQTIGFSSRGAPAVFTLTADSAGTISVWGWGGDGISGHNSASASYINGIQLVIPEPATMTLLSLGLALLRKKNQKS